MDEESLPTLFENLKNGFPKLDDEIIWSVMTMFPLDGNWDTVVINKLLEISGEHVPEYNPHEIPVNDEDEDNNSVYVDNTLPMEKGTGQYSDMNNLTRRKDMDWDEFDKDFKFDYKKKNSGVNVSRFMDTLSNMWNNMGGSAGSSSNPINDGYEMKLLGDDKKRK